MNDKTSDDSRKGPVVKTGPTRGEVRSRNQDGRWREKRSDAGKPRDRNRGREEKKGCFLTTAVCEYRGLPDDCFELSTMRGFRDEVLLASPSGRALVRHYYEVAPQLVPLLEDKPTAEWVWGRVQETVGNIAQHDHQAAIESYQDLVFALLRRAEGEGIPPQCRRNTFWF